MQKSIRVFGIQYNFVEVLQSKYLFALRLCERPSAQAGGESGSQKSVTQRFKRDSFIKTSNLLKMPNLTSCKMFRGEKTPKLITLTFYQGLKPANYNCNFQFKAGQLSKCDSQIRIPRENSNKMSN